MEGTVPKKEVEGKILRRRRRLRRWRARYLR